MTNKKQIKVADQKLIIKDQTILSDVPDNVIFSTSFATSSPVEGIFVGAQFQESNSRHVISLGSLCRDIRFFACFQFRLWWMSYKTGNKGRDIPLETQFLLLESNHENQNQIFYTVFLPIIEGPFHACLQGNSQDHLEICFESGDPNTKSSSFTHSLFIFPGETDPFAAITGAVTAVKLHLQTFRQRHEKKLPGIADYFGWCTWDAFYEEVTPEGVEAGLKSLSNGGTPPKFLIIDDGWQTVVSDLDPQKQESNSIEKSELQLILRLTGIEENEKFIKNKEEDKPLMKEGIEGTVKVAKERYGVKYVYMWHAIIGYWGGVLPGTEEYVANIKRPSIPPGVMNNEPTWKSDARVEHGIGLVNPSSISRFYEDLHGYLATKGVDGVKVDVQCVLQALGEELGGRVELTRQYHQALEASVAKNFPDNGIIACMNHNTDSFYW